MHFICFMFIYRAVNWSQLGTVCEESGTMTQFIPSEIWKRHAVLFGIHVRRRNMMISELLGDRFLFMSMKTKYPVYIMVFGVVTSDSDVIPSFIFRRDLRLNTEAYIKYLKEIMLPWI